MTFGAVDQPLLVVVGGGGVGKTTLAAALGLVSAREGRDTLVMTFDPSARLKDALGVGEAARDRDVVVATGTGGRLHASLLDARATFDRLVRRYAPDEASCRRILENHFYQQLAGNLAGILEYMAVERLFEVVAQRRYDRVVLDTPPTRQALDFLEAPERMIAFLERGALEIALRRWFDERGRLRATSRLRAVGATHPSVVTFGFTDRVAELMAASDVIVTSSGDTCREARVIGRPMVLLDVVPGHGRENLMHELELGNASACLATPASVLGNVRRALEAPAPASVTADATARRWNEEFVAVLADAGVHLTR